jgi:hypothetical protein
MASAAKRQPRQTPKPEIQIRVFFAGELVAEGTERGPLVALPTKEAK